MQRLTTKLEALLASASRNQCWSCVADYCELSHRDGVKALMYEGPFNKKPRFLPYENGLVWHFICGQWLPGPGEYSRSPGPRGEAMAKAIERATKEGLALPAALPSVAESIVKTPQAPPAIDKYAFLDVYKLSLIHI